MKILGGLDIKRWHAFLDSVEDATVFQTPEMSEVFASTKNYSPLFVAIEEDDEIQSLVLASLIKEGGGVKGAMSSRAVITGGPLAEGGNVGPLLGAFDERARSGALYAQIRNLRDMSQFRGAFEEAGYVYEEHLNYVHDLLRSPAEIFSDFSDGRKKGIKKAESRGIREKVAEGKGDVDVFYEILSHTYREARVPLADKSLFLAAWRILVPKGMARLVLALKGDEVLAARFYLTHRGIIHDWYAGASPKGKTDNASELLVWSAMRWGNANNYKLFDFGGAGKPGEHYGPGEFKRRFGGVKTTFGRFQKIYHPVRYLAGKKGYSILKKLG